MLPVSIQMIGAATENVNGVSKQSLGNGLETQLILAKIQLDQSRTEFVLMVVETTFLIVDTACG